MNQEKIMPENRLTRVSAGAMGIMRQAGFDDYLIAELAKITDRHAGYTDVAGYTERLAQFGQHMITSGKPGFEQLPAITINHMLTPMAGLSSGQCMNNVTNLIWDLDTWQQDIVEANQIRNLRGDDSIVSPTAYYAWSAGHAIGLLDFNKQDPSVDTSIVLDPNYPRILSSREYIDEGNKIETMYSPLQNDFPLQVDNTLPLLKWPIAPEYLPGFFIGRRESCYYVACFYVEETETEYYVRPALKVLSEENIIIAALNNETKTSDEFHKYLLATLSRFKFSLDPSVAGDPYFKHFSYPIETRQGIIKGYRLTKKL